MKYYNHGGITIYNADANALIDSLGVFDAVITDPPYGLGEQGSGINKDRAKGNYADFNDSPANVRDVIVPIIEALIKKTRCVILTPGIPCMALYPQPQSFGCIYQPASVGMQSFGNADAQPIFYYGLSATKKKMMGTPCSIQNTKGAGNINHPCPKPLHVMESLIERFTLPGQTILDPFMGSGTTLLAAKNLNRKCVGIDITKHYCDIAVQRLSQEVLDLF